MSNLPPDEFLPVGIARVEQLRNRPGDPYFYDSDGRSIMYFYDPDHAATIVGDWGAEIGLAEFYPIGSMCSGDWVCAYPSGFLFVVDHDTLECWEPTVSFEDLLRRLEARDNLLHADIYKSRSST